MNVMRMKMWDKYYVRKSLYKHIKAAGQRAAGCHDGLPAIGRASLVFILRDVSRFTLGTVRAQPRFRSHVKSMGDFRLLQITVI